jgi:exonuclease VII small subunit
MARKKSATLFEDSLKNLEGIVEQLEQGDTPRTKHAWC